MVRKKEKITMTTSHHHHILLSSLCLAVLCTGAAAQDFSTVLSAVEENSTTLRMLRSEAEADRMAARTGLAPDDPEVEFGYLWETAAPEGGHRIDISAMQSFAFPTVYYWKRKIADRECAAADYRYAIARKKLLLETRQLCIDLTYRNALQKELDKCLENAETIRDSWQEKYDSGAAGIIDLNRAKFTLLSASRTARSNAVERDALLSELRTLNGGREILFDFDSFASPLLPDDFELWYGEAVRMSSELQSIENDRLSAETATRLAAAERLPKFSIGYVSERVSGSTFQGIGAGISVPLWENHGKLRAAKARHAASDARLKDEYLRFHNSLKTKYDKARHLADLCLEYRETLSGLSPSELLYEALMSGEITLEEYVYGIELWYDALADVLESERDCQSLIAELESFAG